MPLTLLYHDVTPACREDTSGFPGHGAAHYKLTPENFGQHLAAIAAALKEPPITVDDILLQPALASRVLITFDDGGNTALAPTADLLEQRGWRGHFFITTDYIDQPTFLSRAQLRELRRRGHVIGSHSCSHPTRMSYCSWEQLLDEWGRSRNVLEDILGEPVTTASVPGGFYSKQVARAAAQSGYRVLFNSEPTARMGKIDGCLILGRYSLVRSSTARQAAALAQGRLLTCLRQTIGWNLRKVAKVLGGRWYLFLRERLLRKKAKER